MFLKVLKFIIKTSQYIKALLDYKNYIKVYLKNYFKNEGLI